jgi:uncharacterized iron-regulated protein
MSEPVSVPNGVEIANLQFRARELQQDVNVMAAVSVPVFGAILALTLTIVNLVNERDHLRTEVEWHQYRARYFQERYIAAPRDCIRTDDGTYFSHYQSGGVILRADRVVEICRDGSWFRIVP